MDWFRWLIVLTGLAAATLVSWLVWTLFRRRSLALSDFERERLRRRLQATRPLWTDPHNPPQARRPRTAPGDAEEDYRVQ